MSEEKGSGTLKAAWIMLLVMAAVLVLGGLGSLATAYRTGNESIAGFKSQDLARMNPELLSALRGRRATAASLSVMAGLLIAWIGTTAFRRGEKWAWWALLTSVGLGAALSLLRVMMLDLKLGAGNAAALLVWLVVALGISYRDMK
jgi:hypothetical protein